MTMSPERHTNSAAADEKATHLLHLREVIDHAAHLLPAKGPINVFIHHNTLHAFEDLPFSEAVRKGAHIFGCQPYLAKDQYREELHRGRIRFDDLQDVLRQRSGDAGRSGNRSRKLLVATELALAFLVCTSAGVMAKSALAMFARHG